jgi:iron complex outermembrane receptor protein
VFPKQWLFYWDDDDSFINYTVDFSKTNVSNRPGTVDAAEKLQILEQTLQMLENFK